MENSVVAPPSKVIPILWLGAMIGGCGFAYLAFLAAIAVPGASVGVALVAIGLGFAGFNYGQARVYNGRNKNLREEETNRRLSATLKALNIAHQAVSQSESRYRGLIDSQKDVIFRRDPQGRLTLINDAMCKIFGLQTQDALGQLFHPADLPIFTDFEDNVLARIKLPPHRFNHETELGTVEGPRSFEFEECAIFDNDAHIVEIQTIARDITFAKAHRESLMAAKSQATAANQAKTNLIAMISQEIRTPMNGILGMSDLLLDTEINEEQRTYARAVQESGEELLKLIDDLLDFARVEAGRMRIENRDFHLQNLIDGCVKTLADQAAQKAIALTGSVDIKAPLFLIGDPDRLRQVISNFVANGIRHTASGGVSIKASRRQKTGTEDELLFEIIDTGEGVNKQDQENLFVEFNQIKSFPEQRPTGPGLGLTISKRIIETMGGEICVESTPGHGSCFWFTVPLVKQNFPQIVDYHALDGANILIVEANPVLRAHCEALLRDDGGDVITAESAEAALAALWRANEAGKPMDLVIAAHNLPDASAGRLAQHVRNDKHIAYTPIMVMIAPEERAFTDRLKREGFNDCILTPFRRDDFLRRCLVQLGRACLIDLSKSAAYGPGQALARQASQQQLRVLLAEDNFVNQLLAVALLEKLGAKVDTADNGQLALEATNSKSYDMVFMDIQIPEIDGMEVTRRIRKSRNRSADTPIIAMTASALAEDREDCLNAGMDDYLAKPINLNDLRRAVSDWKGKKSTKTVN